MTLGRRGMKKYNADKLKKIHVYPLIIIVIIVVFIIGVAIAVLVAGICDNMTNGKISQGYKWAYGFYSHIKDIDVNDKSALDDAFNNCSAVVNDVTGVSVIDGESVLYKIGEEIFDSETDAKKYSLELESDWTESYKIYLDSTDKSYFDRFASGDLEFVQESIQKSLEVSERMDENSNINDVMNLSVFQQTCYYGFVNDDGTITYITLRLYITVQDIILVQLVCISIILICSIFILFVIFMFVRFARSQRRLLKLYYADKETGGNNWYYFLGAAAKKMRKYRRKSVKAAMVHIQMEKYRSYCSCYGDREGSRLVSDFYDVIRKNITRKETFARHERCDFGILLCYVSEEQLVERVEKIMQSMAAQAGFIYKI